MLTYEEISELIDSPTLLGILGQSLQHPLGNARIQVDVESLRHYLKNYFKKAIEDKRAAFKKSLFDDTTQRIKKQQVEDQRVDKAIKTAGHDLFLQYREYERINSERISSKPSNEAVPVQEPGINLEYIGDYCLYHPETARFKNMKFTKLIEEYAATLEYMYKLLCNSIGKVFIKEFEQLQKPTT